MTTKQIDQIAKQMGLERGKGTYNGKPYWVRPSNKAIFTKRDIEALIGGAI